MKNHATFRLIGRKFSQKSSRFFLCVLASLREANRCFFILSFLLWISGGALQAQTPPDVLPPPKPAFPQLFPHPTGLNGYEDLVRAGDALLESKRFADVELVGNDAPLSKKRDALDDPFVLQALGLLATGLNKPISSPQKIEDMGLETLFPQYAQFRKLARLLALKTEVDAADGHNSELIRNTEMGLQLGYATGQDVLISGLVGIAIDAIALSRMSNYVPQLSRQDCDALLKLLEARLALPSLAAKLMQNDRDFTLNSLRKSKADLKLLDLLPAPADEEDTLTEEEQQLRDRLLKNPDEFSHLLEAALKGAEDAYNDAIANANLPAWKRKSFSPPQNADLGVTYFQTLFSPSATPILNKFDQDRASLQLLALQVSIRRFRWEHDRLPNSLVELKKPDLTNDPYTGQPLLYSVARDGETYDLHSAGALALDENGKPTGGRNAVYLPSRPRN